MEAKGQGPGELRWAGEGCWPTSWAQSRAGGSQRPPPPWLAGLVAWPARYKLFIRAAAALLLCETGDLRGNRLKIQTLPPLGWTPGPTVTAGLCARPASFRQVTLGPRHALSPAPQTLSWRPRPFCTSGFPAEAVRTVQEALPLCTFTHKVTVGSSAGSLQGTQAGQGEVARLGWVLGKAAGAALWKHLPKCFRSDKVQQQPGHRAREGA